jgi:putative acetyltransferase
LVLGLVAEEEGIVGYVAFSRLGAPQADLRATALAPLAVRPECQRKGIGSALVRDGLSRLSEAGEDLVLVVGEATFYERCGFSREAAAGLSTPYDGPHLLAKALSARGSQARGPVCYAPAFAKLG